MPGVTSKRRRGEYEPRRPKKKIRKFKKQAEYHSSSEDDEEDAAAPIRRSIQPFDKPLKTANTTVQAKSKKSQQKPVQKEASIAAKEDESEDEELDETAINTALNMSAHESGESDESSDGGAPIGLDDLEDDEFDEQDDELADDDDDNDIEAGEEAEQDEDDEDDEPDIDSDDQSETSTTANTTRKKRNDPDAFATSISKILTTKLTTAKRNDPILSRSRTADEASKALADSKLESKARAAIRAEKRSLLERGRVQDVLGLETPGVDTGAIMEEEKRLKKIAQRGVVKLFNAVRAAQVRAEEAESKARAEGVVGMRKREDRVNEMSKEGFLDLISRGGKQAVES